jgi:DNA-directed RNA polymerase specialized sigma24 family protein
MSSIGSITRLFNRLQQGEQDNAQRLWELYFRRLVGLARRKLGDLPRGAADEEDVALSAFDSFCRGAERGRFPHLADRDDLWQMLMLITARKASDLRQHEGRDRRNWRRVEREAGTGGESASLEGSPLAALLSREPDPAFAAEVAEECRRLLGRLGDEELRQIVLGKMEGCTNPEIAARVGCSLATVERRLGLIRLRWEKELPALENFQPMEDRT